MTALPNLTASDLASLRRMCNLAADDATYNDAVLNAYAQRYALVDKLGTAPQYIQTFSSTAAPTFTLNPYWIATYDLHATAADVWEELAAPHIGKFSFSADGARYEKNQIHEQYMKMARHYRARRATGAFNLVAWAGEPTSADDAIINAGV